MGKQWKQWQTLFWGAPKSLRMVTAAMKFRHLLLGRKVMTNLDSILKSRDITLPTYVHLVKAMVFPVVMYRCEIWTIKKTVGQVEDSGGTWWGNHFLPHKFIRRTFERWGNSTNQLLNAFRGHLAPRKAARCFQKEREEIQIHPLEHWCKLP